MTVIDCDAHVEESVATWSYLPEEWYRFRPIPVEMPEDTYFGEHNAAWIIDYKLRLYAANPTTMKRATRKGASIPIQEMQDVEGRLSAMDDMGIDVQVVFPSLWLGVLAENVELEAALARSFNEFMADRCRLSNGRLRYAAVVAWRRPDLAIEEIRRVKAHGQAASIFARGLEWDMPLSHPSFRPIYEEAAAQGLPITVHVGNGSSPTISHMFEGIPRPFYGPLPHINPYGTGIVSQPYVVHAFTQIMGSNLLEEIPNLRVGFMEAGCEWVVRVARNLRERKGDVVDNQLGSQIFVACEFHEDIPYVVSKLGEDVLVTATDYPHGDAFRQDQLRGGLSAIEGVTPAVADKILGANPSRLFGF